MWETEDHILALSVLSANNDVCTCTMDLMYRRQTYFFLGRVFLFMLCAYGNMLCSVIVHGLVQFHMECESIKRKYQWQSHFLFKQKILESFLGVSFAVCPWWNFFSVLKYRWLFSHLDNWTRWTLLVLYFWMAERESGSCCGSGCLDFINHYLYWFVQIFEEHCSTSNQ